MPTTINGTGITFPNGTTQTTAASGAGTVTSVATGNGLQGGTITTSGTLSVACPTFNTVGSYVFGSTYAVYPTNISSGGNYSVGSGNAQCSIACLDVAGDGTVSPSADYNISGTWKWMGSAHNNNRRYAILCRVA